ncbi:MAG: class I SAM-dependent methyltransferase [Pseudomonadota bacterium]
MTNKPSARILDFVDALPLRPGMRVLEIGCGTGVAVREVARRVAGCFVLGIDRSERAVSLAQRGGQAEIDAGLLEFRTMSAEALQLGAGEEGFDLAFAMRVGAFDGRHPDAGVTAMERLRQVMKPNGKFFIDTGDPAREIPL